MAVVTVTLMEVLRTHPLDFLGLGGPLYTRDFEDDFGRVPALPLDPFTLQNVSPCL